MIDRTTDVDEAGRAPACGREAEANGEDNGCIGEIEDGVFRMLLDVPL